MPLSHPVAIVHRSVTEFVISNSPNLAHRYWRPAFEADTCVHNHFIVNDLLCNLYSLANRRASWAYADDMSLVREDLSSSSPTLIPGYPVLSANRLWGKGYLNEVDT